MKSYYFASFVIKQKLDSGGFIDSGYGSTIAEVEGVVDGNALMDCIMEKCVDEFSVEKKRVHILTLNKL